LRSYGGLKSQDVEKFIFLYFFWKNDPLLENLQNSVPKGFVATPIDVLCSNFVKFGADGKSVKSCFIYRTKNSPGSPALATAWIAPKTGLGQPQTISSKSVHFGRSYIRTRAHRQSALESESNIRLKHSFEPNNNANIFTAQNVLKCASTNRKTILLNVW